MITSMKVDVACYGDQETIIELRYRRIDLVSLAAEVRRINNIDIIPEIDETALGAGLVDLLRLEPIE